MILTPSAAAGREDARIAELAAAKARAEADFLAAAKQHHEKEQRHARRRRSAATGGAPGPWSVAIPAWVWSIPAIPAPRG